MWCKVLMFQPIYHVSVSPTDGNGPTQGQRKTLTRVGFEPTTLGFDHHCSTDWATRSDGSRSWEMMLMARHWVLLRSLCVCMLEHINSWIVAEYLLWCQRIINFEFSYKWWVMGINNLMSSFRLLTIIYSCTHLHVQKMKVQRDYFEVP